LSAGEIALCAHAAEQYAHNYHAWVHRLHVTRGLGLGDSGPARTAATLRDELVATGAYVRRNVAHHGAWHYRLVCITDLLTCVK
jgi:hypothetical protein